VVDSALDFVSDDESLLNQEKGDSIDKPVPEAGIKERIKIIGVGGGGNNALDHIVRNGVQGVEFLAVNTDAHCLEKCLSVEKLMLGEKLTRGLGAGARPEIGESAALESREEIRSCLKGCDMVYLAAGMGGGTGTGALPVIAEIAKDMGILTVSVVTRPFSFEGKKRKLHADEGIEKLKKFVDALIVVPNDRLLQLSERTTSLADAFAMADNVLCQAVQGVTDLITKPGAMNVDFADLRSIMKHAGGAVMGIGSGKGETRANDALRRAMECPLMESSVHGAKGVILNVTASPNIGLLEVQGAASVLQELVDPDAIFIWGMVYDEDMADEVQMIVIATGFELDSDKAASESGLMAKPGTQPQQESLFDIASPIDTPAYLRMKEKRVKSTPK
jgi:cell division protein FtsZ